MRKLFAVLALFALAGLTACADSPTEQKSVTPSTPDPTSNLSIGNFEAVPASLPAGGGESMIKWVVNNPTRVTVTPRLGEVGAVGIQTMRFDSTTVLTLAATGKISGRDTTLTATVMVTVALAPPPQPPDTVYSEVTVTPNGPSGDGLSFIGFNSFQHTDDVSLLRTWTLWPAADSVQIIRNEKLVAGSASAWVFVAVKTDTIAGWYQSWETPESDYGRLGNFQVSFRQRPVPPQMRIDVYASRTGLSNQPGEYTGLTVDSDPNLWQGFYTYHAELAQVPGHIGLEVTGPNGTEKFRETADTVYVFKVASNYKISGAGFWTAPDSTQPTTLFFTAERLNDNATELPYPNILYHGRNGYSDRPTHFPWCHLPASFRIPNNPAGVPHYTGTGWAPRMQETGRTFRGTGPNGLVQFGNGPVTEILPERGSSFSTVGLQNNNFLTTVRPN